MPQPRCRKRSIALGRRSFVDALHFTRRVPTANTERTMQLADVVAARREAVPRPSWGVIMTKAFALAARNHPEMRSAYFSFPWGHVGEYESQIASVVVNRRIGDEDAVFLAPLVSPESQSLASLHEHLRRYNEEPVESFSAFRWPLRMARLPGFLRRFLYWLCLDVLPSRRARHFGTFGVTTMSPFGAKTLQVPTVWTAFLHYGVLGPTGEVPVGVSFDHRVVDGSVVGYTLLEMEQALRHEIAAELRSMRPAQAA
jgi:hypothetical protein